MLADLQTRIREEFRQAVSAPAKEGDEDECICISLNTLRGLTFDDFPEGVKVRLKTDVTEAPYWTGYHFVKTDGRLTIHIETWWNKKYWSGPLSFVKYFGLFQQAVRTRIREHGDIRLTAIGQNDQEGWLHYIAQPDKDTPYQLCEHLWSDEMNFDQAPVTISVLMHSLCEKMGKRVLAGYPTRRVDLMKAIAEEEAERAKPEPASSLRDRLQQAQLEACLRAREAKQEPKREPEQEPEPRRTGFPTLEDARDSAERGLRMFDLLCSQVGSTSENCSVDLEEEVVDFFKPSADERYGPDRPDLHIWCRKWSTQCDQDDVIDFSKKIGSSSRTPAVGFLISWNGFTEAGWDEFRHCNRDTETELIPITQEQVRASDLCFESMLVEEMRKFRANSAGKPE